MNTEKQKSKHFRKTSKKSKKRKTRKKKYISKKYQNGGSIFKSLLTGFFLYLGALFTWHNISDTTSSDHNSSMKKRNKKKNPTNNYYKSPVHTNILEQTLEPSNTVEIPDKDEWMFHKNALSIGDATFLKTLNFFIANECKCLISFDGNDRQAALVEKFFDYNVEQKQAVINYLFEKYDEKEKIKYKECKGDYKNVIFYIESRVQNVIDNFQQDIYNSQIIDYIKKQYDSKLEELDKLINDGFFKDYDTVDKMMELPCSGDTWNNYENQPELILKRIMIKILFGSISTCKWKSSNRDELI